MKRKIFSILDNSEEQPKWGKSIGIFIVILITLNVTAVILETVENINDQFSVIFYYFEIFSVIVFTLEYLLRIWSCTADPKFTNPISGRLKYGITFLTLVDLFAILPFYLPFIIGFDLRFIRAMRMFRFFRILKIGRYSKSMRILGNVFNAKKSELFVSVFIVLILLLISSSLMFFAEHESQPEAFSSIPATMWWGIATLTTVGYGDMYPITVLGKFLGAIISLLGIGMVALPAGILASGFSEELSRK